ncbi:MAG TPA: pilus assembly protein PilP [Syntrophorhabdaceae bacterium]|nr:pilus assembly protein PilP [Syntrophorhabdaceae bacterium]HPU30209.1 pilus assembly protein PilP [Syntrophorhabdaceae bacterium]
MLIIDKVMKKKCFLQFIILLFFMFSTFAYSNEPKPQSKPEQKKPEETLSKFNIGDFTYSAKDRRDPFESMFHAKILKSKNAKALKTIKEGYELEELKLVGILKSGDNRIAMMEDMQGRGILFKKGDYINRNLWVVDIVDGQIILGYRLKGEIRTFTLDIPRKKEGM